MSAHAYCWPLAAALLAGAVLFAADAKEKHNVVFEVSADGRAQWESAARNVRNLVDALGGTRGGVAVVAHGKGLGMLLAADPALREPLENLSKAGVEFLACENTMRRMKVTKGDLFPFVSTVDSGVAEVVRRQTRGWAYIKSGE